MSRISRFAGALTTGLLVVGGLWYFRPAGPKAPLGAPAPAEAPRRGGQLVATVRAEPRSFNRIAVRTQSADLLSALTQARLLRVNRATFELEPWLAERWDSSPDGLTHTLYLREGLKWSDGTPLAAEDVAFSVEAATDGKVSALASNLIAGGKPIAATVVDARTVRVSFAGPSGQGLRMLDALPIVPGHKLEAAYRSGKFAEAWSMQTPPADVVGLGPFVFASYEPGQRVVLERNPHYWRKAPDGTTLPYLDRIVLEVVPDQNAELLRLQSGQSDLPQDAMLSRRQLLPPVLELAELTRQRRHAWCDRGTTAGRGRTTPRRGRGERHSVGCARTPSGVRRREASSSVDASVARVST